jgi:hypothetical protein
MATPALFGDRTDTKSVYGVALHSGTHRFAERWGITRNMLDQMRFQGRGPKYLRLGARKLMYRVSDIEAYEVAHFVDPAARKP